MKTKKAKNSVPLTNTVITTSSSNTLLTTSGTTTTTNYTYNPSQFSIAPTFQPSAFSLSFSWDDKTVNISLKNGNDIFKLANAFMKLLDNEGIEYDIKTNKNKR
jgi:hypothetical protein